MVVSKPVKLTSLEVDTAATSIRGATILSLSSGLNSNSIAVSAKGSIASGAVTLTGMGAGAVSSAVSEATGYWFDHASFALEEQLDSNNVNSSVINTATTEFFFMKLWAADTFVTVRL